MKLKKFLTELILRDDRTRSGQWLDADKNRERTLKLSSQPKKNYSSPKRGDNSGTEEID